MLYIKLDIQRFADGKVVIETDLDRKGFETGLNKMQSIAKTGFTAIATSVGVVTTALAGIVTAGVKSFADLEQNIGGIETLFKDSADTVIENAEKAYKTAGMSANKYMETVTGFSARLLQGLEGDTEEAARIADIAVQDMSDNANKMGTSMEMITNAYQGFAKQNYTMLDNLKLGYGGTATEMARLINDSGVLGDSIEVTAETVNNVSFDKMIEAIHVIQDEMEITGTTSKEASTTITGSMNSAKAAWDNFINGSGDIEEFVETGIVAIENLADAVIDLTPNIIDGLIKITNTIVKKLPSLFDKIVPSLIEGATDLILTLLDTLISMLPQLMQMGITLLLKLIEGIAEALPELIPTIVDAVLLMVETLLDNIDLIIMAGIQLIIGLALGLIEAIPRLLEKIPIIIAKLVTALSSPEMMVKLIEAGIQLTWGLAQGLVKAIPELLMIVPTLIQEIFKKLKNTIKGTDWLQLGKNILNGVLNGMLNFGNVVKNTIKKLGNKIVGGIKDFFGIKSPSRLMRDEVGKFVAQGIGVGFEDELDSVYNDMQRAIDLETDKMTANVQASGTYQMAMAGTPTFNLLDNTNNTTQLVVNGRVLAEVVNTENKNREVAVS